MGKELRFVTTNENKVMEMTRLLQRPVKNVPLELKEIQGTIEEVAIDKAEKAAQILGCPVLVEDSALCFDAFKSMPGPYVKQFMEAIGCEGLVKLLDSFEDRKASAICIFALCDEPGKDVKLFKGEVRGRIVGPRGSREFGWDPIFEPEGCQMTFGEMPKKMKDSMSHRMLALMKLKDYVNLNDLIPA